MNQSFSKAVSFTNSYFALADGLVLGLENYLADDVVLDWFGKTIKGRTNVAAFMSTHKVNSRHAFSEIFPTDSIGYEKKPSRRSRRRKSGRRDELTNNGNISFESWSDSKSTPSTEIISSGDRSRSSRKSNESNINESDLTFELRDDELSTLFKLEKIKSTNIEEIEEQINKIRLEENFNSELSVDNGGNNSDNINLLELSMKFVEAHGEILFSKKSRRQNTWSASKLFPSSSTHTWRKPCKLQIAYSSQKINVRQVLNIHNDLKDDCSSNSEESEQKSLNKNDESDNHSILNDNDLAGHLKKIKYIKEKDLFFKNLEEYISKQEADELGLVPQYVGGQLVFQNLKNGDDCAFQNYFIFNHLIHVIIYQGRSRCKMNLSQKFL